MGLREALAAKQRRTASYLVPVADSTDAAKGLADAEAGLRLARSRHGEDSAEASSAQESVSERKRALDACFYEVTFSNLAPDEFEALLSAHEPTPEQKADGKHYNLDTLLPALVAACSTEQDLSEAEWAVELKSERWSAAERMALFDTAMSVNVETRSRTVPFG